MKSLFLGILLSVFTISAFAQNAADTEDEAPATTPAPETKRARKVMKPAPVVEEDEAEPAAKPKRRLAFILGADLNFAQTMKFSSVTTTAYDGTPLTGSVELKVNPAIGLMLGMEMLAEDSWGFNLGLVIEGKRDVTSQTSNINGQSRTYDSTSVGIQMNFIEASANYRWDLFYLPFGFNYSIPVLSGVISGIDAKGAIGAQVGAGFALNEHVRFEALVRTLATRLTTNYGIDYGTGYLSGLEARFHWAF